MYPSGAVRQLALLIVTMVSLVNVPAGNSRLTLPSFEVTVPPDAPTVPSPSNGGGVGVGVGVGSMVGVGEGDGLGEGEGEGDGDGLGEGEGDGLGEGDGVELGVGEGVGLGVGEGVGVGEQTTGSNLSLYSLLLSLDSGIIASASTITLISCESVSDGQRMVFSQANVSLIPDGRPLISIFSIKIPSK